MYVPPPDPLRRFLAIVPRGRVLFLPNEEGKAFAVASLSRRFRDVLDAPEANHPEGGWAELQVHDMRRTGVVGLAEAGCTIPGITAISGHDTEECRRIIDIYLPRTVPLAKAVVRRGNR